MKTFELQGTKRTELGKKASKALRAEEMIPCIIYGGETSVHFYVTEKAVRNLIYSPDIFAVELTLDGKKCMAVIKELQFHPVTDNLLHIDFLEVFENKPIIMEVPVELVGHAEGVKAGGKLQLEMRKLKVKAPYTHIPERLNIDVTNLGLGRTLQVGALHFEGLELANAKNAVVCSVRLTRAARGAAAKA